MGNARSNYERHENDDEQQRIVIGKEFRLVLGQLDFAKGKKVSLNTKQQQHRKLSSSSSNSTITSSSSSDHQHSSVSLIPLDIPTSPFDPNEFDTQTLIQYLSHQQADEKELSHIFKIPSLPNRKSQLKTLPTIEIAAIYYDQTSLTNDLNIERLSLLNENELEEKIEEFYEKNILSIFISKSIAYLIYTKNLSARKKYKLVRSKTTFDNSEWLQPFIDYSKLGYRLCGIIPSNKSPFTISWLFEQMENPEIIPYDYCLLEYQFKSFSLNNWTSLLNFMFKQEWKLVNLFEYHQKKKNHEQLYFLLFFQRLQKLARSKF